MVSLPVLDEQRIPFGKHLPDAVYVHASTMPHLASDLRDLVTEALAHARLNLEAVDVIKIHKEGRRVSLLAYPTFFESGFPALEASWLVDLDTGRVTTRRYDATANPPILHRKETLLHTSHPKREAFEALTRAAEELGLFENAHEIGHQDGWTARLERIGVRVRGNGLVTEDEVDDGTSILRHRTALARYALSTPMQALWKYGYLDGGYSVFDYGCGRGDDLSALRGRGLTANGWDPHFAREAPRIPADVVNLGFVLNVIENLRERQDALLGAYGLAQKVLAVAVLIGGRSVYEKHRLFRDGVLTQRGTFQKYFTQSEIREYLQFTLKRDPIPIAPGVFFVFRSDEEEQRFLELRQRSFRWVSPLPTVPRERAQPRDRTPRSPRPKAPTKWEIHTELLDAFYGSALSLGRIPDATEFHSLAEVRDKLGKPETVLARLVRERGDAELHASRSARKGDLTVYLALNILERRRSFAALPEGVRRDVKDFFGSFVASQTEAQALLYAAGKPDAIHAACRQAAERGIGHLDGDHDLQVHSSLVPQLPGVLRAYVGFAGLLYGAVDDADLVKIHIHSGKLTLTTYDDFFGKPVPELIERVKIDFRRQDIRFFEYGEGGEFPRQLLYLKSRYMPKDHPTFTKQVAFDEKLQHLKAFSFLDHGPTADEFSKGLAERGVAIRGFGLIRPRAASAT